MRIFAGFWRSRTFYLRLGQLLSGVGISEIARDPADRCLTIDYVDLLIDPKGVSGDAEKLREFLEGPQGEMPGILQLPAGVKWAGEVPNERPPWISSGGSLFSTPEETAGNYWGGFSPWSFRLV